MRDPGEGVAEAAGRERLRGGQPQHLEEVVGGKDTVVAQLVAAQLHRGHLHDPQKAGGGGQHILRKVGDGRGKLVYFHDAGSGQLRHGHGVFLRFGHGSGELMDGLGHPLTDQKARQKACDEGEQHGEEEHLLHPVGEGREVGRGHHAHQIPAIPGEGGVPVVEIQRHHGGCVGHMVLHQTEAAGAAPGCHSGGAAGKRRTAAAQDRCKIQREGVQVQHHIRAGQQIEAGAVALQFGAGQLVGKVAGQKLHADDAVDGAVRQDEGLAVIDGLPVVTFQSIGGDGPVAVISRAQLGTIVIGRLERRIEIASGHRPIGEGGGPALVGGDALLLHQPGRCPLEQQVGIVIGGRGVGVQIPQIDGGQALASGALVQVVGVQHQKDAGHRPAAQSGDELWGGGFQQGVGGDAAAVQRGKVDPAAGQQLLRQGVDLTFQSGKLLRIVQGGLDVSAAVLYLHGEDILRVLVQLGADPHHIDGRDEQCDLHQQHTEHRLEDGAENGALCAGPGRFVPGEVFHGPVLLSKRVGRQVVSRRRLPARPSWIRTTGQSIRRSKTRPQPLRPSARRRAALSRWPGRPPPHRSWHFAG